MNQHIYIPVEKNLNLWVESLGVKENETVTLISGAGAGAFFWSAKLCDSLADQGNFVIKYDHRDFGYSGKVNFDERPYDVMDMARDAIAILDHLQVEKSHIVGHSMGGFIAQLMAIHFPERVCTITSASSSTNSKEVPSPSDKTWKIFMDNKPGNDFEKDLEGFLRVWEHLNGTADFDREMAIEYTRNLYARQEVSGPLGESHVKAQENLTDRSELLRSVKIPALLIHGKEDYLMDPYGSVQAAECLQNSKLSLIPEMGHIPFNRDILRKFEDEIISFIAGRH